MGITGISPFALVTELHCQDTRYPAAPSLASTSARDHPPQVVHCDRQKWLQLTCCFRLSFLDCADEHQQSLKTPSEVTRRLERLGTNQLFLRHLLLNFDELMACADGAVFAFNAGIPKSKTQTFFYISLSERALLQHRPEAEHLFPGKQSGRAGMQSHRSQSLEGLAMERQSCGLACSSAGQTAEAGIDEAVADVQNSPHARWQLGNT